LLNLITGTRSIPQQVKVVIADTQDLFRGLLHFWIQSEKKMTLVGETGTGKNVMELVQRGNADMLIIDPMLPKVSGFSIARRLHDEMPDVRLVAVYDFDKPYLVDKMQKAGFHGCISKSATTIASLRQALESITDGNAYFCAQTCRYFNSLYNSPGSFARILSQREQVVLRLISGGRDNDEIGRVLHLSPATVQTHRRNLFRKLGIHDTPSLMRYAMDQGFGMSDIDTDFPE
jgi:two-component system, NarL family, nitrate/nitrite response regulator NarL